jgi:hypothetical protein
MFDSELSQNTRRRQVLSKQEEKASIPRAPSSLPRVKLGLLTDSPYSPIPTSISPYTPGRANPRLANELNGESSGRRHRESMLLAYLPGEEGTGERAS